MKQKMRIDNEAPHSKLRGIEANPPSHKASAGHLAIPPYSKSQGIPAKANEDGAVLVIALIMLVLLTILGITISSTSEVELQIAGNEEQYKMNLYQASAGAMECAQFMDEEGDLDPSSDANDYLHPIKDPDVTYDPPHIIDTIRTDAPWGDTNKSVASTVDPANTWYLAVYAGKPGGTELEDSDDPVVHEYTIFARSTGVRGSRSIVKMGYRTAQ